MEEQIVTFGSLFAHMKWKTLSRKGRVTIVPINQHSLMDIETNPEQIAEPISQFYNSSYKF